MIQQTSNMGYPVVISPDMKEAEAINQILRGEISAVEAYHQVMKKINSQPEKQRLETFLESHQRNVDYWTQQADGLALKPEADSGPWGHVVEAFVGAAKLFGETATLIALQKGEEHGKSEYETLLRNKYISAENKRFVTNIVMPELEQHIESIEAMKKLH